MYIFITIYIIKGSAYTKIIAYKDRMSHLYITHTGVRNAREGLEVKRRVLAREQAKYNKGSEMTAGRRVEAKDDMSRKQD